MPKKKPRAIIQVPDGKGGMTRIRDRRFEKGDYLDVREFEGQEADTWLQYLAHECQRYNLQCAGISQIDVRENSGSYTIRPAGEDPQPELLVVWERKRDGPLIVRSQLSGTPTFDEHLAMKLLNDATTACIAGIKEQIFCAGYLTYDGLPWHGEHWLGTRIRIGSPPREYTKALSGPRAILVEMMSEGIDATDAQAVFQVKLREIAAFLSVILRRRFRSPTRTSREEWVWTLDDAFIIQCDVRQLGYEVPTPRTKMPHIGIEAAVPTFNVTRPYLESRGIRAEDAEISLPSDIDELWTHFVGLPPNQHRQFLQAAELWQLSNELMGEFDTASVAYSVAACEALKSTNASHRLNAYDVIETLLGKNLADKLRSELQPVQIRHGHFHAGQLHGSEFRKLVFMESFHDPKFREIFDEMRLVTAACIIEWLRKDGVVEMAKDEPWKSISRGRAYQLATCSLALGVAIGWWLGRTK